MKSDTNSISFFKNVLSFSYASLITAAIGFVIIPFATRLFSPSEMGKINLFSTVASLFSMLAIAGIDQSYVRYHAEVSDHGILVGDCIRLSIISWAFVSSIVFLFREYIAKLIIGESSLTLIIILILYILFTNIQRFSSLDYRLKQDAWNYTLHSVLHALANNVLFFFIAYWNRTALFALGMRVFLVILLSVIYIFFFQKSFFSQALHRYKASEKSKILKFGLPLLPASIFYWINGSVSKFILARYWGFDIVGFFGIALTLSSVVGIIQTGFNTFWAPYAMKYYESESVRIQKVHHYIVCILSIFVICLMLFQDIIFLLLDVSYQASQQIFPLLIITHVLYTISETTGLGIPLSGKTYFQAILVFLSMIVNILLCVILIPRFGLIGCAISVVFSDIIMVSLRTILGQKYYKSVDSFKCTIFTVVLLLFTASLNLFLPMFPRIVITILILLVITLVYLHEIERLILIISSLLREYLFKLSGKRKDDS
ncbi:Membrane protein involved in the export of O-antigen and teichoic acid [Sphaerochaeta associata]|uniref:Oligosaccharide flippase family protein n=1 Tax=Sphaerochaeta associata TaxID=1129264 RepID=A0ABY4DBZ6_9SPIR|nr:oligosaccharide flippase family protein [Sphaerochaeta associata]UOM51569.1 oligosaccharide flippase family protein [Sphaerochaeta associata]SMP65744.1 Membrane protein involved in the export of O-antigen and teichoic acid [Sphaerochaeta associata]